MEEYKGIYYNESKEEKFFEGGAHFRYKDLFQILLALGGILPNGNYYYSIAFNKDNINTNNSRNINPIIGLGKVVTNEKDKKNKPKTRNINNMNYINHPNTKINLNTKKIIKKTNLSINKLNHIKQKKIIINNFNYNNENIKTNENINHSNNDSSNLFPNTQRYNINNNLLKEFLHKKLNKNKKIEKIILNNFNNNENKNIKKIINFSDKFQCKNKSDNSFKNDDNNNRNNNFEILNNIQVRKNITFWDKNNINNIKKQIKNNKINFDNKNIDKEIFLNKDLVNKKNNFFIFYNKSKMNLSKIKLLTQIHQKGNSYINKSRNLDNINYLTYIKTFENNKNNEYNYNFNLKNNINKEENNNSSNFYLNNKTINFNSFDNNISIANEIKNKHKVLNLNKKIFQKYIKKKVNQCYDFNKNNIVKNNGQNIFSRNINSLNYNFKENNTKFKTSE